MSSIGNLREPASRTIDDGLQAGQAQNAGQSPAPSTASSAQNSTTSFDPASSSSTNSSPNAGAREATVGKPPGHKEIEAMTEERLMEDPDYRDLKAKLESCEGLEAMFHEIDKTVGFRDDSRITLDDILALVNDVNQPNKTARNAAKWLNDHREVLAALKGDDNLIGLHDVKNFIAGMKAELKGMKDAARADIKAENGVTAGGGGAAATAAVGAAAAEDPAAAAKAADAKAIMAEADQALPKPAPSQFSGLEGASENMNNMIGWGESEIDRLTTLMGKTDDPAALKQLENKINQMSRRMQQMTALMNQIMTAMQNISKMYSDIAMNSVRNIR